MHFSMNRVSIELALLRKDIERSLRNYQTNLSEYVECNESDDNVDTYFDNNYHLSRAIDNFMHFSLWISLVFKE